MKYLNTFESLLSNHIAYNKESKFTDPRDGKTYRTVVIDDTEWFLDNLDYDDTTDFGGSAALEIFFTKDELPSIKEDSNRNTCGRFYRFNYLKNACPDGWEIPQRGEFINLFKKITRKDPHMWGDYDRGKIFKSLCGFKSMLELTMCGGYDKPKHYYGTSSFGGQRSNSNGFDFMGNRDGYYWSSTPGAMNNGGAIFIFKGEEKVYSEDVGYGYYPVRPIRKNI